jgi:hypothetical protein
MATSPCSSKILYLSTAARPVPQRCEVRISISRVPVKKRKRNVQQSGQWHEAQCEVVITEETGLPWEPPHRSDIGELEDIHREERRFNYFFYLFFICKL